VNARARRATFAKRRLIESSQAFRDHREERRALSALASSGTGTEALEIFAQHYYPDSIRRVTGRKGNIDASNPRALARQYTEAMRNPSSLEHVYTSMFRGQELPTFRSASDEFIDNTMVLESNKRILLDEIRRLKLEEKRLYKSANDDFAEAEELYKSNDDEFLDILGSFNFTYGEALFTQMKVDFYETMLALYESTYNQ
jgi:hypothetical protein